jgi:hypothetical protein
MVAKIMCNPETGITRIKGPQRLLPGFEGEHLERAFTSGLAFFFLERASP